MVIYLFMFLGTLEIVPWSWIINIMDHSYFLILWWLRPRERLNFYLPELIFLGSEHSLDSAWSKSPHQRKKHISWAFPDLTSSLLYWALCWLCKMPTEWQNEKGELLVLFTQVQLIFAHVFCIVALMMMQHKVEAAK